MIAEIPPSEHMEAELRQIRGVVAVRVVSSADAIAEIHVLAGLSRPVKQIIRDVESICAARFRVNIDHRCISVAQIDIGDGVDTDVLPRLQLHNMRQESTGDKVAFTVQFAAADQVFNGEAEGPAIGAWRPKVAALAAVHALEDCLGDTVGVNLGEVKQFEMAGKRGYMVVVSLLTRSGEDKLLGCTLVQYDDAEACVRAVLDAVSRRITNTAFGAGTKNANTAV